MSHSPSSLHDSPPLFPPPAVPVESRTALLLARTAARMVQHQCMLAMTSGDRTGWQPDAVSEIVRIANSAAHLHEALEALTRG